MSAEQVQTQDANEHGSPFEQAFAQFNRARVEARRIQSEIDKRVDQVVKLQMELEELKRDHNRVRKNAEYQGDRLKGLLENEIKNW